MVGGACSMSSFKLKSFVKSSSVWAIPLTAATPKSNCWGLHASNFNAFSSFASVVLPPWVKNSSYSICDLYAKSRNLPASFRGGGFLTWGRLYGESLCLLSSFLALAGPKSTSLSWYSLTSEPNAYPSSSGYHF